jgi:hypothetical protein
VSTPRNVVQVLWTVVRNYRSRVSNVVDFGAGDGRLAAGGNYQSYLGIEIDQSRTTCIDIPSKATIVNDCAFKHPDEGFALAVGNPPYVRHHDLEPEWRDRIASDISRRTGIELNRKCNLYVYFLFLSLLKTSSSGLVALIVPYEWLSRPSSASLRQYIKKSRWQVDVYRFDAPIFDGVETTASISVIDKRNRSSSWKYHSIDEQGLITGRPNVTGTEKGLIDYDSRGAVWAMRGMSPGSQKIFTLTDGERIHAGLTKREVYPCVTTLRHLPQRMKQLTEGAFRSRYVDAGKKCWLIKSHRERIPEHLRLYLETIPKHLRDTATCANRDQWYRYTLFPLPDLLVSSGFVGSAPKAVINSVGAYNVGGVHGVHRVPPGLRRPLQHHLTNSDFASQIVSHSGRLRKIEVRQLNTVLNNYHANLL